MSLCFRQSTKKSSYNKNLQISTIILFIHPSSITNPNPHTKSSIATTLLYNHYGKIRSRLQITPKKASNPYLETKRRPQADLLRVLFKRHNPLHIHPMRCLPKPLFLHSLFFLRQNKARPPAVPPLLRDRPNKVPLIRPRLVRQRRNDAA